MIGLVAYYRRYVGTLDQGGVYKNTFVLRPYGEGAKISNLHTQKKLMIKINESPQALK